MQSRPSRCDLRRTSSLRRQTTVGGGRRSPLPCATIESEQETPLALPRHGKEQRGLHAARWCWQAIAKAEVFPAERRGT
jgi:hypothetical protein